MTGSYPSIHRERAKNRQEPLLDATRENIVMYVSVIISTYNSPKWLEKVIWGYQTQNYPQF